MRLLAATANYAALVRPLQLVVMIIALLFFVRVMRVAIVESKPRDGGGARRRRGGGLALRYIEPREMKGERLDVSPALVIGRSPECDVILQDTYLSSRHARVASDDGDLTLEDLGSTNGTYVNQQLVRGRVLLERGDIVQVGGVLFEVVR